MHAFTPQYIRAPASTPGRLVGSLQDGEDVDALARVLLDARERALSQQLPLLTHADDRPHIPEAERLAEKAEKLARLGEGRLKRYVVRIDTEAGPRIVKIAEPASAGNRVHGIFSSVARSEHAKHQRCHELGIAAAASVGYLEWRRGALLTRAAQFQEAVPSQAVLLEPFLAAQLKEVGPQALDALAIAIAKTHAVPFFHGDLKSYHAYVHLTQGATDPSSYALRWIDLARVSFHLTPRKRIINLYQCLRFVVPQDDVAQQRFISAYCTAAHWHEDTPEIALAKTRRLLAYKLRTHPNP